MNSGRSGSVTRSRERGKSGAHLVKQSFTVRGEECGALILGWMRSSFFLLAGAPDLLRGVLPGTGQALTLK